MSRPSSRTPLLGSHDRTDRPERPPGWLSSLVFFFGSWWNVLLVFVPLSIVSHNSGWAETYRFTFGLLAIIPLAALAGIATEQIEMGHGRTLPQLLSASLGNMVEIVVGFAALRQDQLRVVQTSLVGSILSNLLLVLGFSFLAGGMMFSESNCQVTAAQASSSLLTLACITLIIPAAYHGSISMLANTRLIPLQDGMGSSHARIFDDVVPTQDTEDGIRVISHVTAVLLLLIYIASLIFEHRTHKDLYLTPAELAEQRLQFDERYHLERGSGAAPWVIREREDVDDTERRELRMNVSAALFGLLLATIGAVFCAEYLVASIEETSEKHNLPKAFIGLIMLPAAVQLANAHEHYTAIWMARRNQMEATISINVGNSIQIATFVVPLLVIAGWVTQHNLTLRFDNFETIVLFVSVILVNSLIQDGKSNYKEGLMLITLYLVIAIAFWVS